MFGLGSSHSDRQLWGLWHFLCGPHQQWPQDVQQSRALSQNVSWSASSTRNRDYSDILPASRKDLRPRQPGGPAMEASHTTPAQDGCAEGVMGEEPQQARWIRC